MHTPPRILVGPFQRALILERPDESLDEYLRQIGVESDRYDDALDEDELVELMQKGRYHLVFKRSRTMMTRKVIAAADSLHAIMLCCVGDDSVDKQAAADHGVLVFNDPISNGRSVVELVMGEAIGLARRLPEAHTETRSHRFIKGNANRYELAGRTLGVLGLGNIGKSVASVAANFGLEVIFYDSREVACEVGEAMGWTSCGSIEELFARAHVVTVHLSAEDHTGKTNQGILGYEHFRAMNAPGKDGPRIYLNASRGFLHEAAPLIQAVEEGHIHYAFVDVYPDEPKSASEPWVNPYAGCARIFATPHIGAATQEAQPRIAQQIAATTRLLAEQGAVRDCVFRPGGRTIQAEASPGRTVLAVVHSDARGTKKAVDDAVYEAGASNLNSTHRDFPRFGIAYDLNILDGELTDAQLQRLAERATQLTGDVNAIRSIRQFTVPKRV